MGSAAERGLTASYARWRSSRPGEYRYAGAATPLRACWPGCRQATAGRRLCDGALALDFPACLSRTRAAFVHKRQRSWTAHVTGFDPLELETCALDQYFNRAIEVAAAADTFPGRRKAVLPPTHVRFRSAAVFDEEEPSAGLKHAIDLPERRWASGMLHNVQVITTLSTLLSSNGIASAEPSTNSTRPEARYPARRAIERSLGEGSRPITSSTFRV